MTQPIMITSIFSPVPTNSAKAVPEAPFAGKMERKAAHTMILGESSLPSVEVVNYASEREKKAKDSLTFDTVLSKAEDKATLERIADHIYRMCNGHEYKTITIN